MIYATQGAHCYTGRYMRYTERRGSTGRRVLTGVGEAFAAVEGVPAVGGGLEATYSFRNTSRRCETG
jgi:hypothetical protein